jgi:molybdopterin converting factor small subunit
MPVTVRYFARMSEIAGCASESVSPVPPTPAALFARLSQAHDFGFGIESLRVAVNDRLVDWESDLREGDEVALIPPVSGG